MYSCICDEATSNRQLYHLLTSSQSDKHKVLNKYSKDERFIYLICDPPYLLKTIRNCFTSRPLWVSIFTSIAFVKFPSISCIWQHYGEYISWQHAVDLYHCTTGAGSGVSLVLKLKYEHIMAVIELLYPLNCPHKYNEG